MILIITKNYGKEIEGLVKNLEEYWIEYQTLELTQNTNKAALGTAIHLKNWHPRILTYYTEMMRKLKI